MCCCSTNRRPSSTEPPDRGARSAAHPQPHRRHHDRRRAARAQPRRPLRDDLIVMSAGRVVAHGEPGTIVVDELVESVFGLRAVLCRAPRPARRWSSPPRGPPARVERDRLATTASPTQRGGDLGGHPVAALDRAVHERRPAQRGVRAGEVHPPLRRAQRAPGRVDLARPQHRPGAAAVGIAGPVVRVDADDLAPGASSAKAAAHRGRGRRRRAPRPTDRSRRARPSRRPWSPSPPRRPASCRPRARRSRPGRRARAPTP